MELTAKVILQPPEFCKHFDSGDGDKPGEYYINSFTIEPNKVYDADFNGVHNGYRRWNIHEMPQYIPEQWLIFVETDGEEDTNE